MRDEVGTEGVEYSGYDADDEENAVENGSSTGDGDEEGS